MNAYLFLFLIGFIFPIVVKSSQLIDARNEYIDVDKDSLEAMDEPSSDESPVGDQTGIYKRVLHNFYQPYLKKSTSKRQANEESRRWKREQLNYRKPLLFKRQVQARKPILLLGEPLPSNPFDEEESDRDIVFDRNTDRSRSMPFRDDDIYSGANRVERVSARSDVARRPILVSP